MLHVCLLTPFSSPARQQQFEAVRAALAAEPQAPATLLLGNLPVPDAPALDAVVLRPHSITVLLLEPRGGQLSIRDFAHAAWQLDNAPLTGVAGSDNPFQQFREQQQALQQLLRPHLDAGQANLNFITGLLLFGEPVVFGREVEESMAAVPAAASFQLLADPARFTRRLHQLATPEIELTAADLAQLARELPQASPAQAAEPDAEEPAGETEAVPPGLLQRKARQLWQWLGAHDVDDLDTPAYGYDEVAARQQEKQALETLRATMQAEVADQLRALQQRDAAREQSIAQLREQLAAVPAVAADAEGLQERLRAESREKDQLEAAMRASRAEAEARNRELDAKIQQLTQVVQQLQAAPATNSTPGRASAPARGGGAASYRRLARQWRRRLPSGLRIGAAGLVGVGLVAWAFRLATAGPPVPFEHRGQWGFVAADGDTLVPARYASASSFQNDRAIVEQQGAFGFVDARGKQTVAPAYDALNPYADGYARVRIGDLYTFIDEQGTEFSQYYYNALDFSEGRAAVLDRRGWYYISGSEAETKPPVVFQEAYSFHDGRARVKQQGAYTFISTDYLDDPSAGTAPFGRYTDAADFVDGRARVVQEGRTFYIDRNGKPVP